MEIFLSSFDLMRLSFLLGAVLALIYKKKFGITPGGIIVPGILVSLLFHSYTAFLLALATTALTLLIYRLTIGKLALSRRWASLITIALSTIIGLIAMAVSAKNGMIAQELALLTLVGPGLITVSANKYGLGKVAIGTLSVTAATYAAVVFLGTALPHNLLTWLSVELAAYQPLQLLNPYLSLLASLFVAALVYLKFGLRSGGYLIAPFIAVVSFSSPIQAALLAVGTVLSYLAVKLMLRFTLLIGLERFVFSLFCGYIVVSLMDLLAVTVGIPGYRPAPIMLIIAVAVLTNDLSLNKVSDSLKKGIAPALIAAHLVRAAL